jgi:hypothetical protein
VREAVVHFDVLLRQTDDLRPDARTLALMMAAFVDHCDALAAVRAFSDVTSLPVQPDTDCINLLLTSLGQLRHWKLAWDVLRLAEASGTADLASTRIMVEVLHCTVQQLDVAADVVTRGHVLRVAEQVRYRAVLTQLKAIWHAD